MKTTNKILALEMCLCLLFAFTGCTDTAATEHQALSVVVNATSVFPQINAVSFKEEVYNCLYSYGEVSSIICDGQPSLALHVRNEQGSVNIDNAKREMITEAYTTDLLKALNAQVAEQEQVNTLGAIHMAADTLHGSKMPKQTLLIVSSGLDTAGALNFSQSNLLDADPAWIVEQLVSLNSVPDLSGIDVIVMGLGQTAGDQPSLDNFNRGKLEGIWTAILKAGNPNSLTIDPTPLPATAPSDDLPFCSTVAVISAGIQVVDSPAPEADVLDDSTVIRVDERVVRFESDKARFADPSAAYAELAPAAELLMSHPEVEIILAGTTASVGGDGIDLSLARAEAVKSVLTDLGVNPAQLKCIGLGRTPNNPLRVNDLDENGCLIEEKAKLNRAVFLFRADSSISRMLGL